MTESCKNLVIYKFPSANDLSDVVAMIESLVSVLGIATGRPLDVIIKCIGIKENGDVEVKLPLIKSVSRACTENESVKDIRIIWMINAKDADLTHESVIISDIIESLSHLKEKFDGTNVQFSTISIDVEPLIDSNGYNIIPFHTNLIHAINHGLNLPVSVYISPAKIAAVLRRDEGSLEMNQFTGLLHQLSNEPPSGNVVYIPAYTNPDPCLTCDLKASAQFLSSNSVHYKFIIGAATKFEDVEERIDFLHTLQQTQDPFHDGYVIYHGSDELRQDILERMAGVLGI